MTNPVSSNTSTPPVDTATGAAAKNAAISKDAFLHLLVAQVKNQDPLKPTDGVEFLTQLAQFTQLEQMIGMRSDLSTLAAELKPRDAAPETSSTTQTQTDSGAKNV